MGNSNKTCKEKLGYENFDLCGVSQCVYTLPSLELPWRLITMQTFEAPPTLEKKNCVKLVDCIKFFRWSSAKLKEEVYEHRTLSTRLK